MSSDMFSMSFLSLIFLGLLKCKHQCTCCFPKGLLSCAHLFSFSFLSSKAVIPATQFFSSLIVDQMTQRNLLIPSNGLFTEITVSFHLPMCQLFSCVCLFVTPWTVACQAPLSMGFSRQEYWSGLPFPSPEDLPDQGIEPESPALQADSLTSEPPRRPISSAQLFLQFSSVTPSCPTLCHPMNRSMPGPSVHHQLLEFTQTHVH